MANSFVQVPPDSTGKLVDTFATDAAHERQAIVIGDPDTSANIVPIGSDGLLPIKGEQQLDYATSTTSTAAVSVFGIALPGTTGPTGVSVSNPLPVTGTVALASTTVIAVVSGTVAISNTAFNTTISNTTVNAQVVSGTTIASVLQLSTDPTTTSNGLVSIAVIHGRVSTTSTTYLDVKVNPSGALAADVTGSSVTATVTGSVAITNTAFNSTISNASINTTITGSIANTAFNTTISNVTLAVVGNVADGSAATGNPVRIGLLAKSPDGTDPGNVDEDDVAAGLADLNRRHYVNIVSPQFAHFNTNSTTTISTIGIASPGAGLQLVLTNVIFSSGTTSAPSLTVRENSTTGTIKLGPIYLEAIVGRGFASGPIALPITVATSIAFLTIGSGNQAVDVDYYIQKV